MDENEKSAREDTVTRRSISACGSSVSGRRDRPANPRRRLDTVDRERRDPGPANPALERPESRSWTARHGRLAGCRCSVPFPLQQASIRGRLSREVTIGNCRFSRSMAGVNMRAHGRESVNCTGTRRASGPSCCTGTARITAVDADGRSFVADVGKNDLVVLPPTGIPISSRVSGRTAGNPARVRRWEFLGVCHRASERLDGPHAAGVLRRTFGVSEKASSLPRRELLHPSRRTFRGPLEADRRRPPGSAGPSPHDLPFAPWDSPVMKRHEGGRRAIVDSRTSRPRHRFRPRSSPVRPGGLGTALAPERSTNGSILSPEGAG